MKRVFAVMAVCCALVLATGLVACGGGGSSSSSGSSASASASASASSSASASASASTSASSSSAQQSASSSAAPAKSSVSAQNIPGRYDVVEVSDGNQTIKVADLPEAQRASVAQQYWVFNADGTVTMFDESQDFSQTMTWKLDGTTITISVDGVPAMTAEYDGKSIVIDFDGMRLVFQKTA